MQWEIVYIREVGKGMKSLNKTQQIQVLKAIHKVASNPLPNTEGGYGKPLGNHLSSKLSEYMKIKLLKLGLRIVYGLERKDNIMKIIIVSTVQSVFGAMLYRNIVHWSISSGQLTRTISAYP